MARSWSKPTTSKLMCARKAEEGCQKMSKACWNWFTKTLKESKTRRQISLSGVVIQFYTINRIMLAGL